MVGRSAARALMVVMFGTMTAARAAPAAPPAGAAADKFRPLRSASASATSFLQNNWNRYQENYHPSYALDENPATAWVEGVDGYGEGQSLTIPVSPLSSARAVRLRIWNGYQKSKDLFAKNSMPRKIQAAVLDATGSDVAIQIVELQNTWGPQTAVVAVPPQRGLAAVRVSIISVYPGTKYKDTCISDVLVDVDSDVPHNAAAEAAKFAALKTWVADRRKTAAYFASKPAEYPFAFTHFKANKDEGFDRAEFKRLFAEADALRAKLGATRYKPAIKKRIHWGPDGLAIDVLESARMGVGDFLELFSLSAVALFETSDELSAHHKSNEGGYSEEWTTSARAVTDGAPRRFKALAFDRKSVFRERTTSTSDRKLLLAYDDAGRLQRVYRESREVPDFDYEWIRVSEIYSFAYDAAGKVTKIELLVDKSWLENDAKKQERDRKATRVVFTGVANPAP